MGRRPQRARTWPESSIGFRAVTQQISNRYIESLREFIQVVQAEVAFGSFYAADVGSMQPCLFGQGFLGPASESTQEA